MKNPAILYEVSFFFLHYGWFLQYLGKEAVPTFMHTTVYDDELWLNYRKCGSVSDLSPGDSMRVHRCGTLWSRLIAVLGKYLQMITKDYFI